MSVQVVNVQSQSLAERETDILRFVRISRYFYHTMNSRFAQFSEESVQKGRCIMEASGIHKLNMRLEAIIQDTVIFRPLSDSRPFSRTIVRQNLVVHISAAMSLRRELIIAEMHFVTILAKSLHLVMDFLADTTHLGKAM